LAALCVGRRCGCEGAGEGVLPEEEDEEVVVEVRVGCVAVGDSATSAIAGVAEMGNGEMRCLDVKNGLWRFKEYGEAANWYRDHAVLKVEGGPDSCGMSNPARINSRLRSLTQPDMDRRAIAIIDFSLIT